MKKMKMQSYIHQTWTKHKLEFPLWAAPVGFCCCLCWPVLIQRFNTDCLYTDTGLFNEQLQQQHVAMAALEWIKSVILHIWLRLAIPPASCVCAQPNGLCLWTGHIE